MVAARPRAARIVAAPRDPNRRRAPARYRRHHRRRGGGPPRSHARRDGRTRGGAVAQGLGRARPRRPGLSEAGTRRARLACRVYAPVGSHEDLLPYLVRRLLENGANSSFVNRIADEALPVETLIENPVTRLRGKKHLPNPRIVLPRNLFVPERLNSAGHDL